MGLRSRSAAVAAAKTPKAAPAASLFVERTELIARTRKASWKASRVSEIVGEKRKGPPRVGAVGLWLGFG